MKNRESANEIHNAVERGDIERIRRLIQDGSLANAKTVHHVTPLMTAAKHCRVEIAQFLIAHGADVKARDRRSAVWEGQCSALHYAIRSGCSELVELLLRHGADPDCQSQTWNTPLSESLEAGRHGIAEMLLSHGALPNGPERCNRPPIVSAAAKNNRAMVDHLLRMGASPNRFGGDGMTALGVTTSPDCLRSLVDSGADPNLTDGHGFRPIHRHLVPDELDLVRLLVDCGASLDGTMPGNITPLMLAVMTPRSEIVRLLIELGANINAVGNYGTALDICHSMSRGELGCEIDQIASVLQEFGGKRTRK